MRSLIFIAILAAFPTLAGAAVYRCANVGGVSYQDAPCGGAQHGYIPTAPGAGGAQPGHQPYTGVIKESIIRGFKDSCGQKYRQHGASGNMAESICACQADVLDRNYTTREFADIVERGPQAMSSSPKFKGVGVQLMRCEP
ncbi:hypothetical protein ACPRNU_18950 [Chromobacterium vaccinii]|uniref:hypothetical protein n=1 Tax=Chromobacterium vaccinii TaxID=1108595 RepID=UPI003C708FDF